MITTDHLQQVDSKVTQVERYLKGHTVEYVKEPTGLDVLFRLAVCPFKGRECDDRTWIIVRQDGKIQAGCHGGKCEGKGWKDLQKALGGKFKSSGSKAADPALRIVESAERQDTFFHDAGVGHVQMRRRGCLETLKVREDAYRGILALRFRRETKEIAKGEHLKNAVNTLEALAVEEGPEHRVHVRIGYHEGKAYLDLGDRKHFVEVDSADWRVVTQSPVYFRRPKSMRPLALPERGGDLDLLRGLINIAAEDLPLLCGAMVMVYHRDGPYPVVNFHGGAGRAKSSTIRDLRRFLDPAEIDGSSQSDGEDLMIAAKERRLLTFDNLDVLSQRQSDDLCRLATGASLSRRKKYSDADETIFVAKNPVFFTSVKDVMQNPDLLSRAVRFALPPLRSTKAEQVHDAEIAQASPKVLGLVLTALSAAIRNLPRTTIAESVRMMEFALWGTAAEEGFGLPPGSFMESYRRNLGATVSQILDTDLAQKIIELGPFRGRSKELAERIGWGTTKGALDQLVGELKQLSSALESRGIIVDPDGIVNGFKTISIEVKR